MSHTKEPWSVFSKNGVVEIWDTTKKAVIGWTGFDSTRVKEDAETNARRIVACVNACAGIPTADLERSGNSVTPIFEMLIEARKQRDELLAALEMMNRAYVNLMENGRDRIIMLGGECDPVDVMESNDPNLRESRAAIASAKGFQKDNLRSFSLRLDREEWGHVIDGLILERERSLLRKSENSESNSNEISDCCAKLIGRINRACAISTLSETPIASVKGGAA